MIGDERGLISGFIIRTVLILGILGVAAVDGGSILFTKLQVQDIAESAAIGAGVRYGRACARDPRQANPTAARQEAERVMESRNRTAIMKAFEARTSDCTIRVTVQLKAGTIAVQRIGAIEDWGRVRATGEAGPPGDGV